MTDSDLEDIKILFIGAWDVLGRRGPELIAEIKTLRARIEALEKEKSEAQDDRADRERSIAFGMIKTEAELLKTMRPQDHKYVLSVAAHLERAIARYDNAENSAP